MRIEEITEEEWPTFCESFSRQHHGWLVTVSEADSAALDYDVQSALSGERVLEAEQPLQSVKLERNRRTAIFVEVGEDERRTFTVEDVRRLWRVWVGEAHEGVRVDDRKGRSLLVEFRAPAAPEALDGLAASER